ncbi:MAG: hypothetical protein JRL30_20795 [Deltaproteobacteria bacterium]|nr:hypothetical protein [Deltaproteobacteria bacterium]
MSLILKEGTDVESFKRVILSNSNRINRCRLGPEILDLAARGKNSHEIAEALKADGKGGLHPVSSSTVSRWLRATGLFRGRSRPGAESERPLSAKELFKTYEEKIQYELEALGPEFLVKIRKAVRKAGTRYLRNAVGEDSRSDRRER